jgi:hypothetical protein
MRISIQSFVLVFFMAITLFSCIDSNGPSTNNPYDGFLLLNILETPEYNIEIYTKDGELNMGYNQIVLYFDRNGTPVNNLLPSWSHTFDTGETIYSGPRSSIQAIPNNDGFYEGFVVFQMTGMDNSGWELQITVNQGNTAKVGVLVQEQSHQVVTTFTGEDQAEYVLYSVEPQEPFTGSNDLVVGLSKIESPTRYTVVQDYRFKNDARLNAKGNLASPNNTDLIYQSETGFYQGTVNFSESGLWSLNFLIFNENDQLIKGTEVSDENQYSEVYLEVEF